MTDYRKMSDLEINSEIAKQIGGEILFDEYGAPYRLDPCAMSAYSGRDFDEVEFDPCNNPADAWPIIAANHIGIMPFKSGGATAWPTSVGLLSNAQVKDDNPLRAAMIVFLMMKEAGNV